MPAVPSGEVEEFDFLAPLRLARRLSVIAAGVAGLGALGLIVVLAASGDDSSHAPAPADTQLLAATKAERLNAPAALVTAEPEPTDKTALKPVQSEADSIATRPHAVSAKRQHNLAKTGKHRRSTLR